MSGRSGRDPVDVFTREHILATQQKLSLRCAFPFMYSFRDSIWNSTWNIHSLYIHVPADFLRRRSVQSALIAGGLINWLVYALENHEELTDFTLEYSVALLINVSALKVL